MGKEKEKRGGHQLPSPVRPGRASADDRSERQIDMKSCAETAPPVPRSTSIASETLGFRSPLSARVRVLGERPMREAKADSFSPLRFKNDCSAFMGCMLPNRQKNVNQFFACLALAGVCQTGKMRA